MTAPTPLPTVVPVAAIHACIDAEHDVGTRHEDGVFASASCHTCGTAYSVAGRVGSGEPTEEAPREHLLKVVPPYFDSLVAGSKTFEIRKNDRAYQRGDVLRLREWHPHYTNSTKRCPEPGCNVWDSQPGHWAEAHEVVLRKVTFVFAGDPRFGGLEPGYVILGLGSVGLDSARRSIVTGDRVEAAAKALHHAEWIEGNFHETDAEHCWTQDPADHKGYYDQVRIVLAAADECDRVAGVVRVDTNNLATLERIVYALRYTNWYRGDSAEAAGAVLTAIREIAATGAQPPPEEEQR